MQVVSLDKTIRTSVMKSMTEGMLFGLRLTPGFFDEHEQPTERCSELVAGACRTMAACLLCRRQCIDAPTLNCPMQLT